MLNGDDRQYAADDLGSGVKKVVAPTLMQCDAGGFIVIVPGMGTRAVSTLEEALAFMGEAFRQPETTLPKFMQHEEEQEAPAREPYSYKAVSSILLAIGIAALALIGTLSAKAAPKGGVTNVTKSVLASPLCGSHGAWRKSCVASD